MSKPITISKPEFITFEQDYNDTTLTIGFKEYQLVITFEEDGESNAEGDWCTYQATLIHVCNDQGKWVELDNLPDDIKSLYRQLRKLLDAR